MSEELKAKARRTWEEIIPTADVKRLAEVIAVDLIDHSARPTSRRVLPACSRRCSGWEGCSVTSVGRSTKSLAKATPSSSTALCTVDTGDLMGIPPTNRDIAVDYVHIVRFRDGKAVEYWSVRDDMALMGRAPRQDHLHQLP